MIRFCTNYESMRFHLILARHQIYITDLKFCTLINLNPRPDLLIFHIILGPTKESLALSAFKWLQDFQPLVSIVLQNVTNLQFICYFQANIVNKLNKVKAQQMAI